MTLDEGAKRMAEAVAAVVPCDVDLDELRPILLAELSVITAKRDSLWAQYRISAAAYRDALRDPRARKSTFLRQAHDVAVKNARTRYIEAGEALGVAYETP